MLPPTKTLPVTHRDGSTAQVVLGELTNRQLHHWIVLLNAQDTPYLIAHSAGQPLEWVDTLSDESYAAAAEEAFRVNFPRATSLAMRDALVASKILPILDILGAIGRGPASSDSSPAPASSVSAAETPSGSSISPPADSAPSSPPPSNSAPKTAS